MNNSNNIFFYKNKNWTKIEEEFLKIFINKYGSKDWKKISCLFFYKKSVYCMKKWWSWVNPNIRKLKWDRAEDKKLILVEMRIIFKISTNFLIIKRSNLQIYFRFKFIQIARNIFNYLTKKNTIFWNKTIYYTNPVLSQETLFYWKFLKYNNLNYIKLKLNFINRNKKKYFSRIHFSNYAKNSILIFKNRFYCHIKFSSVSEKNSIFFLLNLFFKSYKLKIIESKNLDTLNNILLKIVKSFGFFLSHLINNYFVHLDITDKLALKKFKKIQITPLFVIKNYDKFLEISLDLIKIFFFFYRNQFLFEIFIFILKNLNKSNFIEFFYKNLKYLKKIIFKSFIKNIYLHKFQQINLLRLYLL